MSTPRGAPDPDHEKSYELGDLELAPRPAGSAAKGAPRPAIQAADDDPLHSLRAMHSGLPSNDFSFDVQRGHEIVDARPSGAVPGMPMDDRFEDDVEGPSLELDLSQVDGALARASLPRTSTPAQSRPSHASTPSQRSLRTASGRPLDDERRARELAGYGMAEGGIDPARYVVHVALRMVALWRERGPIEQRASELADEYEVALRELGRALLNDPAVHAHDSLTERVLLVRTRQGELDKAQADTRAALEKENSALELLTREAAQLAAELVPFETAEKQAEEARNKAEAAVKRQRAKLQRAEIELRALSKATIPPPAERVQNIEGERAAQQRELEALDAALNEANAALGRARRELALRRGAQSELARKKRQQENATRANVRGHEASVARAEHALSAVLCQLAEAADAVGVAQAAHEQVARLRASETALDEVVDTLARYDRALRMYDRDAMVRGALMWSLLLLAVVTLVMLL